MRRMSINSRCAVVAVPLFLFCLDIPRPLLTDAQPFSYNFPGRSQETLFTVASAILKAQGYEIATAEKYNWVITTEEQRLPLGDQDCDCATDAGIVYHDARNTTTEVVLNLKVFAERIVIRTEVIRKFVTEDPGYGKRFYCVSKGTVENDLFGKIDAALRGGF